MNLKHQNVVEFASFKRSGSTDRASSEDARILIAVDGTIATVDAVFSKVFGYSQDDLEGKHFDEVILPSSKLTTKIVFERKPRNFIVRVLKQDGTKISCIVSSNEYVRGESKFRVLRIQPSRPQEKGKLIQLPQHA